MNSQPETRMPYANTNIPVPNPPFFKRYGLFILAGLVILLVISNLFLLKFYLDNSQKMVITYGEKSSIEISKMELDVEFYKLLDSLNRQKSDNVELNTLIEAQKTQMTQLRDDLQAKIQQGLQGESLQQEIGKMRDKNQENLREIAALRKDKLALQEKVRQIEQEKLVISHDKQQVENQLDSVNKQKVQTDEELKRAAEEKRLADQKLAALDQKLNEASFIKTKDLKVTPMNKRRNKANETSRVKKVDYYKICFSTDANPLAKHGPQKFYLRLLNPLGEPIQMGKDETTVKGKKLRFVYTMEADYDGSVTEHCVEWQPQDQLAPGGYILEVYNNETIVGQTSFLLK